MAITREPYIPAYITVHLGSPGSYAENVTVSFSDYIKNVASSEIYPTWEEEAIRANILAQVSFALNRVYTEFYPSRGYDFNITGTTAMDQKFIKGRNIFDNVALLVDELFQTYIRRQGFVEPLSAKFCNGTTTTCDGLSQWGSQGLAEEGYQAFPILQHYYGYNIELVENAPIQNIRYSYPGYPLRLGASGGEVYTLQAMLNRVAQAYPSIPKINPADGIFGVKTTESVKTFQKIFNLTVDGIVGRGTWYKLVALYVGLKKLSELISEGHSTFDISFEYPDAISPGDQGKKVSLLQYMLSVIAQFNNAVPFVDIDGKYGNETYAAVTAFQNVVGLPPTGVVEEKTWDLLVQQFAGVAQTVLDNPELFPGELSDMSGITPESLLYANSSRKPQYPGQPLSIGSRDSERNNVHGNE